MTAAPEVTDQPTVADRIVDHLIAIGVTTLFGVHGANAEDIIDAAWRTPGITPVIAKHEFAAGAMADGIARLGAAPGAVITTSGGAAFNVVAALAEAYDSRVPVLAIVGSAPRSSSGRGGFQDMSAPPDTVDIVAALRAVTGTCCAIDDPEELDSALRAASTTLADGVPAAIVVPKDIQQAFAPTPSTPRPPGPSRAQQSGRVDVDLGTLATTLQRRAQRPGAVCLWAGEEASRLELGGAIGELADLLGATIVVSPGGRDIGTDGCAGVTGVMGHPSAHRAVAEADFCLGIGCRMSMTDRAGLDDALTDIDVAHVGTVPPRAPGVTHLARPDLSTALHGLIVSVRARSRPRGRARRRIETLRAEPDVSPMPAMRTVIEAVGSEVHSDIAVFADAGNAGAAAIHHLPFPPEDAAYRFVVALGMGGMGYAIAAGVGVAIAGGSGGTPRRAVVIAGDGSFLMHGLELHTAVEHGAPLLLVVLNNNAHGMCVVREQRYFPAESGLNRFRPTDIAAGMAAMFRGLRVRRAGTPAQMSAVVREALSLPGPTCLVVDTDPDEIPPFAPFLTKGSR